MPGRPSIKNDNELHCQERVDKNSWIRPTIGKGFGIGVVFRVGGAFKEGPTGSAREFTKVMGAVAAGLAAGSMLHAQDKPADKAEKHICKGHNACKGKGGCKSGDDGCAGKNSCKGKGGCARPRPSTPARA